MTSPDRYYALYLTLMGIIIYTGKKDDTAIIYLPLMWGAVLMPFTAFEIVPFFGLFILSLFFHAVLSATCLSVFLWSAWTYAIVREPVLSLYFRLKHKISELRLWWQRSVAKLDLAKQQCLAWPGRKLRECMTWLHSTFIKSKHTVNSLGLFGLVSTTFWSTCQLVVLMWFAVVLIVAMVASVMHVPTKFAIAFLQALKYSLLPKNWIRQPNEIRPEIRPPPRPEPNLNDWMCEDPPSAPKGFATRSINLSATVALTNSARHGTLSTIPRTSGFKKSFRDQLSSIAPRPPRLAATYSNRPPSHLPPPIQTWSEIHEEYNSSQTPKLPPDNRASSSISSVGLPDRGNAAANPATVLKNSPWLMTVNTNKLAGLTFDAPADRMFSGLATSAGQQVGTEITQSSPFVHEDSGSPIVVDIPENDPKPENPIRVEQESLSLYSSSFSVTESQHPPGTVTTDFEVDMSDAPDPSSSPATRSTSEFVRRASVRSATRPPPTTKLAFAPVTAVTASLAKPQTSSPQLLPSSGNSQVLHPVHGVETPPRQVQGERPMKKPASQLAKARNAPVGQVSTMVERTTADEAQAQRYSEQHAGSLDTKAPEFNSNKFLLERSAAPQTPKTPDVPRTATAKGRPSAEKSEQSEASKGGKAGRPASSALRAKPSPSTPKGFLPNSKKKPSAAAQAKAANERLHAEAMAKQAAARAEAQKKASSSAPLLFGVPGGARTGQIRTYIGPTVSAGRREAPSLPEPRAKKAKENSKLEKSDE
ncbi:uncharacterized protein BCR38DRAFT_406990 [Pseudomassariella vexata]|uniref:Uncharacterized protein n=1 Tax=Pseudomassariella vexata TaxID=1141098 RepID=A0A1Y2E699_9PEZI|nr:uncharacterized protein BCR38DRAFT_406990 [Pseudomassariella vexata]ORY66967.1 hypothetical protein BCR38DRAFT_406990 [Pseudomassariella vexata]